MIYPLLVFAGALLCNCVPHLTAGLQGEPFPTPFAKPRGIGPSSPLVNVLWGAFNLAAATTILGVHPVPLGANLDCLAIGAGALALGIHLSRHFGRVRNRLVAAPSHEPMDRTGPA
ncbi:hypothetical protein [Bradyrhizobium sp. 2TAF24]|uniref:hypothetical protein n=1 Tax=Bradyrhizobium sp. 2TAF24 TaxID=3233011 RepID=UPI003F92FA2D